MARKYQNVVLHWNQSGNYKWAPQWVVLQYEKIGYALWRKPSRAKLLHHIYCIPIPDIQGRTEARAHSKMLVRSCADSVAQLSNPGIKGSEHIRTYYLIEPTPLNQLNHMNHGQGRQSSPYLWDWPSLHFGAPVQIHNWVISASALVQTIPGNVMKWVWQWYEAFHIYEFGQRNKSQKGPSLIVEMAHIVWKSTIPFDPGRKRTHKLIIVQ